MYSIDFENQNIELLCLVHHPSCSHQRSRLFVIGVSRNVFKSSSDFFCWTERILNWPMAWVNWPMVQEEYLSGNMYRYIILHHADAALMLTCDLLYCFEFVHYQELTGLVQGHSQRPCSHEMVIGQSQVALFHAVTIISRVALTGFISPCTN